MNSWELILRHTASGINEREVFLRDWIKRLVEGKWEPQPYLRLVGPECSGKSIFHEALGLLVTVRPVMLALTNSCGFNGELADTSIGVIEGIEIPSRGVRRRLAEWQRREIVIHETMRVPRTIKNELRWIECTTTDTIVLDFPITTLWLERIEFPLPKPELFAALNRECNAFLGTL